MLLQDTQLIETLAHFNRERIPERVVHANAVGAWGEFEVTHDISHLTCASFLNGIGTKSKTLARISQTGIERGGPSNLRDVRGWSLKVYTEEGNQDFVFNSTPVFFIRDPIKFPSLNRSHKRHPATNCADPTMFWDFHSHNPESLHGLMHVLCDRGTPKSVRHVNAFSQHTYKLVSAAGDVTYVKFQFKTDQGVQTVSAAESARLCGADPDNHTRDLYEAIEAGDFPSWTLYIQAMTPAQAETYRWNIFDLTKVWPHADFPLLPVGKLTLNQNPANYFATIEQAAFSPSTMVPGIAATADPVLQARMFAYPDAARYRLGVNYQQLPVNRPVSKVYAPYQRDGFGTIGDNYGGEPNYVRSALREVRFVPKAEGLVIGGGKHEEWVRGKVEDYSSEVTDEDYVQCTAFWRDVLGKQEGQQEIFVGNVAGHLRGADDRVWEGVFGKFFLSFLAVVMNADVVMQTCFPRSMLSWGGLFERRSPRRTKKVGENWGRGNWGRETNDELRFVSRRGSTGLNTKDSEK